MWIIQAAPPATFVAVARDDAHESRARSTRLHAKIADAIDAASRSQPA